MIDLVDATNLATSGVWVLLVLLLKSLIILAGAGLITLLLRKESASVRHLVWTLAILALLCLPVLTWVVPSWHVASWPSLPVEQVAPEAPVVVDATPADAPLAVDAGVSPMLATPEEEASAPWSEPRYVPFFEAVGVSFSNIWHYITTASWPVWVMMVWGGGVLFFLLQWLLGAMSVIWLGYQARPLVDEAWQELADELGDRLFLRRPVRLLRSPRATMPMTWGTLRPVVLLPAESKTWDAVRRRCVLTHEFVHIRRYDCLTQTLAQIACAFYWMNPFVWFMAKAMRQEREKACDDYVLKSGTSASEYAMQLIEIARTLRSNVLVSTGTVPMARKSQLEGRVLSILDTHKSRKVFGSRAVLAGGAMTLLLVLPLAGLQSSNSETPPAEIPDQDVLLEPGRAFRWSGPLEPGRTLELINYSGTIQVAPASDDRTVNVLAFSSDEDLAPYLLGKYEGERLVICQREVATDTCISKQWGNYYRTNTPEIDLRVEVPQGIYLRIKSFDGDIEASGLTNDITVETTDGDITIQTAGIVQATSVSGDISIHTEAYASAKSTDGDIQTTMGGYTWKNTQTLFTQHGDLTLRLSESADTRLKVFVEEQGEIQANLPLAVEKNVHGTIAQAVLGQGDRLLKAGSVDGTVSVTYDEAVQWSETDFNFSFSPPTPSLPRNLSSYRYARLSQNERRDIVHSAYEIDWEDAKALLGEVIQQDPSAEVRKEAVVVLSDMGCEDTIPLLTKALADHQLQVRQQAVYGLLELDLEETRAILGRHYQREQSSFLRDKIAYSLKKSGKSFAVTYDKNTATESHPWHPKDHTAAKKEPVAVAEAYRAEVSQARAREARQQARAETSSEARAEARAEAYVQTNTENAFWSVQDALEGLDINLELSNQDLNKILESLSGISQYESAMARLGFDKLDEGQLLLGKILGVDATFARSIKKLQYEPTFDELLQMKLFGMSERDIKKLRAENGKDRSLEEIIHLFVAKEHTGNILGALP